PYSLNGAGCSHSFCAHCILQWAFSDVFPCCGLWHSVLRCPSCDSTVPWIPGPMPRSSRRFPFVYNNVCAAVLR
ncbi:hypothetical protein K466DRAFT_458920, partial [Polyporus arcularius HHB13444]